MILYHPRRLLFPVFHFSVFLPEWSDEFYTHPNVKLSKPPSQRPMIGVEEGHPIQF